MIPTSRHRPFPRFVALVAVVPVEFVKMSVQLLGKRELKRLSSVANDGAGAGYTSFAMGMMAKMGWAKGQGLGKDMQGRSTYVQVKKKDDNAGLGKEKAQQNNVNDQWYFDAFDSALANMGSKKQKKKNDKKKKAKAIADEAAGVKGGCMYVKMFKATGGARMGMRARASQNGKLARTESGSDGAGDADAVNGAVEATNGAAGESASHKRKRAAETYAVAEASPAGLGDVEVKQENTSDGKQREADSGEAKEEIKQESVTKAERKRDRAKAKKAKRADKTVKVEGGVKEERDGEEPARGAEKAPKKKKTKRAKNGA